MKNRKDVSADQDTQNVEPEVPEDSADPLAPRWLVEASGRMKLVYLGIFLALAIWFVAFGGLWGVLALLFMIALVWGTYAYIAGMVKKKNTWGIIFAMVIVSGGLAKLNRDQERARWTSRVPPHVRPLTLPTTPSPYSNLREVSPGSGSPEDARAMSTATYWRKTVASLHSLRFSPAVGDEPAGQFCTRLIDAHQAAMSRARRASSQNVDRELSEMVTRHLALDDEYLELATKGLTIANERGAHADMTSTRQRTEEGERFFAEFGDDPSGLEDVVAPELLPIMQRLLEFEDIQFDQLREIEIMQATLKERYRGSDFSLPEIAD